MKELYELKDKLCDELKEYGKKDMSAGSLDVVDKLAHTIKNLNKIIEEYDEGNYSGAGMSYAGRMYSGESSYARGGNRSRSYARGRGGNARRDSMGRYSSNGYSYGNESMIAELQDLMEDAPDERTKQEFQRFISKIESM